MKFLIAAAALFAANSAWAQSSICTTTTLPTYFYDTGGRLSAVMTSTGSTDVYSYDIAGNVLSIINTPSTTLQVLQVCPNAAPVGSAVTIWGTNFASSQTVTFNGVMASAVTVMSANEIVATVPPDAASGYVAVEPAHGSKVNSPSQFNIGPVAPQITGISGGTTLSGYTTLNPFPFYGANSGANTSGTITGAAAGTQTLTITGSNFDATQPVTATKDKVWIGTQVAQVLTSSATSLAVSVPIAGSIINNGVVPIATVSTPSGVATYAGQSVLITPAAVNPDIINNKSPAPSSETTLTVYHGLDSTAIDAVTDSLTLGASRATTLDFSASSSASQFVAYIFSGSAGNMINAQVSVCAASASSCGIGKSSGYTNGSILLVAPDGSEVDAVNLGGAYPPTSASAAEQFYTLPQTGTYTLYVQNAVGSASAIAQAEVALVPAAQALGTVAIGSSVSGTISGFQAASATFTVPAGSAERVTLKTSLTKATASPFLVSVVAPDGATYVYSNQNPNQGDTQGFVPPGQIDFSGPIAVPATPAGTTYTINYQSLSPTASKVTFKLTQLPADAEVTGSNCNSWPSSGSVSCSGTSTVSGQAIYTNVAALSSPFSSQSLVASLETTSGTGGNSFNGCFEVLLTDIGLNTQIYRSVQCGGSDFSGLLTFPANSIGPYLIQGFGIGQNIGTLTFTLSVETQITTSTNIRAGGGSKQVTLVGGQPQIFALAGSNPGDWISLSTTDSTSDWCYVVGLTPVSVATSQPFATYFACPTGEQSGQLQSLQLPSPPPNEGDTYHITVTPAGPASGTITATVATAPAQPSGTILTNSSVYYSWTSAPTFPIVYNFMPTYGGTAGQVNLVTIPNLPNSVPNVSASGCYNTQITQDSKTLFTSLSQAASYYVGGASVGCSGVDVSAATALLDSTVGVTDFTLTAALTPSSGNFSETLYNFTPNVASANLTIATGGPAGVTLASTLPGQPVEATFVDSGNAFVNVVVGLDTNISTYCVLLRVTDVTAGGGGVFSQPICAADYNTGAISLPSTTDTYMITVTPQGDAVGNITIGVGAQ